jgi:tetratricopeptide (TPR) repeat protein
MARTSTLRKRALKRMASMPPRELRPSGIKLCEPASADEGALDSTSEISATREAVSPEIPAVVPGEAFEDDASFFAEARAHEEEVFEDVPEDRHSQLDVVQRRSRAASIVRNVLVGCAAVVAIGFGVQKVRAGDRLKHENELRASASMALTAALPAEAPAIAAGFGPILAPAAVTAPQAAPTQAAPAVAAAEASEKSANTATAVAEVPPPAPTSQASAAPTDDKPVVDVKVEKRKAEQALDQGKYAVALEHAQAAVDGDADDAGAWLLLGAVKQAKGDVKGAIEAFTHCVKDAKRGPKHECAAMMR